MEIKGKSRCTVVGAHCTDDGDGFEVNTSCMDDGVTLITFHAMGGGYMTAQVQITLKGARAIAASITAACDDHETIMNLERAANEADAASAAHTGLEKCSTCGLTLARCSSGLTCVNCNGIDVEDPFVRLTLVERALP